MSKRKRNDAKIEKFFIIGFVGSIILMVVLGLQVENFDLEAAFGGWSITEWMQYIVSLLISAILGGFVGALALSMIFFEE